MGTVAEGTFCHKPCTVSGGGKSEISKPITDAILTGPVFVADFKKDFDRVAELIDRDYSDRFRGQDARRTSAPCSRPERSLGSVIKLLTPDEHDYTPEYNAWLDSVPQYVKELVFVVKRYYKPEWGDDWRDHFSVDIINGMPGNELKCDNRKLVTTYLRVGFDTDGSWRTFGLRKDFHPAVKIQMEDDITASVVVPPGGWKTCRTRTGRVAQIRRRTASSACSSGRTTRSIAATTSRRNRISRSRTISSPITSRSRRRTRASMVEDAIGFYQFTEPMQTLDRAKSPRPAQPDYFVSTAHPRLVDGKPSKNPRYLQKRPDLVNPRESLSGGNGRPPAPPRAAGPAVAHARDRRAARPPQQSAGSRHPLAGGVTIRSIISNCRNCSWNSFAA